MGEIADDMIDGLCCSECGAYFENEHGYPVLCVTCYGNAVDEATGHLLPEATNKEM